MSARVEMFEGGLDCLFNKAPSGNIERGKLY